MIRIVTVLGTAAIILGWAVATPVPPERLRPPYYFSTRIGDTRHFRTDQNKTEWTEVIEEVEEQGESIIVTVQHKSNQKHFDYSYQIRVSTDGIQQLSTGGFAYESPLWWLKAAYTPGVEWKYDGVLSHPARWDKHPVTALRWVDGVEEVEVPAGTYKTLRVESDMVERCRWRKTEWYACGIGPIKTVLIDHKDNTRKIVSKMISFKPGK